MHTTTWWRGAQRLVFLACRLVLGYVTFCLQPSLGWTWRQISAGTPLEGQRGPRGCSDLEPNWVTAERSAWFMDQRGLRFFSRGSELKLRGNFWKLLFYLYNSTSAQEVGKQNGATFTYYTSTLHNDKLIIIISSTQSLHMKSFIWIKATYLTFLESWTFC